MICELRQKQDIFTTITGILEIPRSAQVKDQTLNNNAEFIKAIV